jgi:DNA-binding GntR family transcriptional regulator
MKTEREKAYEKIRNAIMFGDLKPGERVVERRICDMLELGRTPVREAFWQLEKDGFIRVMPNKGAYVPKMSIRDYEEIAEVAAVLEGYGVELAAKTIQPKQVEELKKIVRQVSAAAKTGDYIAYAEMDFVFHEFFPELTQNAFLVREIRKLRHSLFRLRALTKALYNHVDEFLSDHEKILEAIVAGNSKKASNAMQKHIKHSKDRFVQYLQENPWFL